MSRDQSKQRQASPLSSSPSSTLSSTPSSPLSPPSSPPSQTQLSQPSPAGSENSMGSLQEELQNIRIKQEKVKEREELLRRAPKLPSGGGGGLNPNDPAYCSDDDRFDPSNSLRTGDGVQGWGDEADEQADNPAAADAETNRGTPLQGQEQPKTTEPPLQQADSFDSSNFLGIRDNAQGWSDEADQQFEAANAATNHTLSSDAKTNRGTPLPPEDSVQTQTLVENPRRMRDDEADEQADNPAAADAETNPDTVETTEGQLQLAANTKKRTLGENKIDNPREMEEGNTAKRTKKTINLSAADDATNPPKMSDDPQDDGEAAKDPFASFSVSSSIGVPPQVKRLTGSTTTSKGK